MKKLLLILVLGLLLSGNSFAGVTTGYKLGKGPLKVTKNTADIIEYFLSGGKKGVYAKEQKEAWKPGLMAISVDGAHSSIIRHPLRVINIEPKQYAGQVIKKCKKKSGQECFLFANGYKIVWNNGTDRKKRRLKRKDIKAGKTIALITELGFFDGSTSYSTNTAKVIKKKTSKKYKEDVVYFNKCASTYEDKKKYHDSFEIDLKNNTIYHEFFAEGEIYESKIEIAVNNDSFIQTAIEDIDDDSFVAYEFNKKNDELTLLAFKDKKGKIKDNKYIYICDDIVGTLKNKNKKSKIVKKNVDINDKDIVKKLKDLKELLDSGVLTNDEFEKAKKKLLN